MKVKLIKKHTAGEVIAIFDVESIDDVAVHPLYYLEIC